MGSSLEMTYLDYRNADGRMSNHFYFCLQAYIKSIQIGDAVQYITSDYYVRNRIEERLRMFNMLDFASHNPNILRTDTVIQNRCQNWWNCYHQIFGQDFNCQQLDGFIRRTFLSTGLFVRNECSGKCGLHLRYGDFVGSALSNCYDRKKYLIRAFSALPKSINTVKVFSDDIERSKNLMSQIHTDLNVVYSDNKSDVEDFIELSCLKTKILCNSTFSYWSAFIGNELYENSFSCVFAPSKFTTVEPKNDHNNPKWAIIDE